MLLTVYSKELRPKAWAGSKGAELPERGGRRAKKETWEIQGLTWQRTDVYRSRRRTG